MKSKKTDTRGICFLYPFFKARNNIVKDMQ